MKEIRTTRRPETHLGSGWMSDRIEEMHRKAEESKENHFILQAFIAGYSDAAAGTTIEYELLLDDYIEDEDRVRALKIYKTAFDLCLKMTPRQNEIFKSVILEGNNLAEAGRQAGITLNGVKKHLIFIGNKGKKIARIEPSK